MGWSTFNRLILFQLSHSYPSSSWIYCHIYNLLLECKAWRVPVQTFMLNKHYYMFPWCWCSGANGELSQETTEKTSGASLISLQPYQAPCPRYKCHLSTSAWDRKSSKANKLSQTVLALYQSLSLYISHVNPPTFFLLTIDVQMGTNINTQKWVHLDGTYALHCSQDFKGNSRLKTSYFMFWKEK